MKSKYIIHVISVLLALTLLAGCHDSNPAASSDNGSTPAGSSNWDQMTWDQDNWG